jgi:hypothetical protein
MSELSREELEEGARRRFLERQAREKFEKRQAKLEEDQRAEDNIGVNALRTFGQGVSFGFGDEIAGGARALLSGDWDSIDTFKDSYASFRDDEREQIARFSEDHPFAAFLAEMGGGALSGGVGLTRTLAKAGAKGLAKGVTAKDALGRGAVEGGVYGFGSAEGDGLDRLKNAGFEGILGAGLGGGLTKLGDAVSKRRIIDDDLVDPETGEFTPLHLLADEEDSIGSFYRSVLGKGLWGGRMLRDQQKPTVSRATGDVEDIIDEQEFRKLNADLDVEDARDRADALKDQGKGIEQELEIANRKIADEAEVAEIRRADADADELARIDSDLNLQTEAIEREFRELAGLEGLPPHARGLLDDVDLNDPKAVNDVLTDFYDNKAFMDVKGKGQAFTFDGEIGEMIDRVLSEDPDLAMQFRDTLIPFLQRKQKNLAGNDAPGTSLVPQDYIEDMLNGELLIDGEALMAFRNLFANNSGGKAAYASRQIKDVFDDYIIKSLDDDAAARFIQDKDFYTNFLSYNKALQATNKQGNYLFTPDQYASAAQTTQIGKVKRNDYPLEGDYVNAIDAKNSRGASAESGKERLRKAQKQKKSEAKQANKQRSRDVNDAGKARINRLKEAGKEGTSKAKRDKRVLKREIARSRAPGGDFRTALDRLKMINKKKVEDTSIATSLNVDRYTGEVLAPKVGDMSRALIAGIGGTATFPLATKGAQKLITGQTGAQKLLADQLRKGNAQDFGRAVTRPFYIDEEDNR